MAKFGGWVRSVIDQTVLNKIGSKKPCAIGCNTATSRLSKGEGLSWPGNHQMLDAVVRFRQLQSGTEVPPRAATDSQTWPA